MSKEKEMRNVGMISASLGRKQKKVSAPQDAGAMVETVEPSIIQPPSPPSLSKFNVPKVDLKKTPTSAAQPTTKQEQNLIPPAISKFYQISGSAPVVEDTLLSTIPPAPPERSSKPPEIPPPPMRSPAKTAATPPISQSPFLPEVSTPPPSPGPPASPDSPLLLTTIPAKKPSFPSAYIFAPKARDRTPSSSPGQLSPSQSFDQLKDKARNETSLEKEIVPPKKPPRPVLSPASLKIDFTAEDRVPSNESDSRITSNCADIEADISDSFEDQTPPTESPPPPPASTPMQDSSANTFVKLSGFYENLIAAGDNIAEREEEEEEEEVQDLDAQEQLDAEFARNISKMIAGFISNEELQGSVMEQKQELIPSSPGKPRKRVRFSEVSEEFLLEPEPAADLEPAADGTETEVRLEDHPQEKELSPTSFHDRVAIGNSKDIPDEAKQSNHSCDMNLPGNTRSSSWIPEWDRDFDDINVDKILETTLKSHGLNH